MTDLNIMNCPSPNHEARPEGAPVDMLVLHYTGMESCSAAMERMCDPEAKVSAHYLIDEDGATWRLVPEERRAWHAGVAHWAGASNINDRSIGIELVNPGHEFGYRSFPDAQMTALESLARDIVDRHGIPAHRVLGHSDIAPDRKQDPGELFDWERLAHARIGLWPAGGQSAGEPPGGDEDMLVRVQSMLKRFGYKVGRSRTELDDETRLALEAFQRHFRPANIDGQPDLECLVLLRALCAKMG